MDRLIRQATQEDAEHWRRMRDALWPESTATNAQELDLYFSGGSVVIEECLLALDNGTPVGFIELAIRSYAEGSSQTRVPYVEGWFVDATYRGRGIGRDLMQAAEAWASKKGYSELASDADLHNTHSISVHKKLGFRESGRIVCFLKNLD